MEQSGRQGGEGEATASTGGGIQLPAVAWAEEEPEGSSGAPAEPEAEAAPGAPAGRLVLPVLPGLAAPAAPAPDEAGAPAAGTDPDGESEPGPGPESEAGPEADADADTEAEAEAATSQSPVLGEPVAAVAAPEGAAEENTSTGQGIGRIPKPVIAAALVGGLVLVGLPLVLSQLGGGGPTLGPDAVPPAGMNHAVGGPEGFVPGFDERGNTAPSQNLQAGNPSAGPVDPNSAGGAQGGSADALNPGGAGRPGSFAQSGPGSGGGTGSSGGSGSGGGSGGSGGGGGTGGDGGSGSAPAPVPAPPAATKTYQAVAGAGCTGSGTGYSQDGWFDNGQAGWKTYGSGGWSGDGCKGSFTAIPMSGAASKDKGNYALWTFRTGQVTSGRCKVSVYVPNNKDIKAVGGNPSYYTVQNSLSAGSGTIGSFIVKQRSNIGGWVDAGTYDVRNGQFAVKLHDRGEDWVGSTITYAHHAASAVRVSCTA